MRKKLTIIFSSIFLSLLSIALSISPVFAQNFTNNELVVLESDQTINEDYFASGERVEVLGDVNGDVYVAGGQIIIEGDVDGDVFAVGGTIEITGNVSEDVYAAGGNVTIDSQVGGNSTSAGGNVTYTSRAAVSGDVNSAGGNISILSTVGQDVRVVGGNVILGNEIAQDVTAGVGVLRLSRGAQVGGNLTYASEEEASIASDATVSGSTHYFAQKTQRPSEEINKNIEKAVAGGAFAFLVASAISTLVIGLILVNFAPGLVDGSVGVIRKSPWSTLLLGLAITIVAPILFVLILITLFGIPLAVIGLLSYIVTFYISRIFVMAIIGEYVLNFLNFKKANKSLKLTAGLISYYVIGFIPVIGFFTMIASVLFGLGAMAKLFAKKK